MQVKTMKSINNAELRFQSLSVLKGSKSGLTPKDLTDKLADIFGLTKEEREEFHSKRPYDKVFYKKVATEEQHLQAAIKRRKFIPSQIEVFELSKKMLRTKLSNMIFSGNFLNMFDGVIVSKNRSEMK